MLPRLYQLLWRIARPLLRKHRRLGEGFDERLAPPAWPRLQPAPASAAPCRLWLHGASGGEAYLIRELALELAARPSSRQKFTLLCTSLTSQGLEILRQTQKDCPAGSLELLPAYLPLDEPQIMRRAVRQAFGSPPPASPALLALLETELWPGLLLACREYGLPTLILNGRLTEKSLRAYHPFRSFLRRLAPRRILAGSPADQERFRSLFGSSAPCDLMPNIKFDRIRFENTLPGAVPGSLIALASVREEEETLLAPLLPELLAQAPQCAIALAPRHLHRLEAWEKRLQALNLPYIRAGSLQNSAPPPGQILLWDSFGNLQQVYRQASAVFVGGSLAPLGGQNFLEPLACGLIPCIGPSWQNFTWVGKEIFDLGLVRRINSAEELVPALLRLLHERPDKTLVRQKLEDYLVPRRGGTRMAVEALAEFL
ncbi:MAG: 3-deoxy-D-manno-octulosonic acid transferase [Desulfovibrionaceae bacterium]|nr:3-deoxy-D-manno-octulosonic acid transferase [Desulfovibrionaceae bacterium]